MIDLLFKLAEDLSDVGSICESDHNVQLLEFDIDRIVVFDKKDLHFILENLWSLLNDQVNVSQSNVLNLWLSR